MGGFWICQYICQCEGHREPCTDVGVSENDIVSTRTDVTDLAAALGLLTKPREFGNGLELWWI